jgi:hypothetical protein
MDTQPEACRRTDHADYADLIFLTSSPQSVDEIITHLIDLNAHWPQPTLRILVRSAPGIPNQPIAYLIRRLYQEQMSLKPQRPSRVAVEFYFFPLATLLETFVRRMGQTPLLFKPFRQGQTDLAVKWLLLDKVETDE